MKDKKGFTIVELLIVIVVIAVLAAITIVAYNGVQKRAKDTKRLSDANTIVKAIKTYRVMNGFFPGITIDGTTDAGWEQSYNEPAGMFMEYLNGYGVSGATPIDSTNTSGYHYAYYKYPAGASSCDSSKGDFFVFGIKDFESTPSGTHPDSPGWACTERDWAWEFDWVAGGYTD